MKSIRAIYRAVSRRVPFVQTLVRKMPVETRNALLRRSAKIKPTKFEHDCAICRSLDNVSEERRILNVLLDVADKTGVTIWRLWSPTGIRFGMSQGLRSSFLVALTKRCLAEQIEIKPSKQELTNNLYEFDQIEFVAPAESVALRLHPKPHCARGKTYLASRGIRLEILEQRKNAIVVPAAGLGPRIMSLDEAHKREQTTELEDVVADWPFPIDLVFTWVDVDDDIWRENYASVAHEVEGYSGLTAATNAARWHSRDELRFSLRSIEMYAPFVRNIYIVTNGQKPKWFVETDRIKVVSHKDLYPDGSVLPTFNSNHIETVLHNIEGMAEHFLYLNDDFFFSRRCNPADFFNIGGLGKIFFSDRYMDARPVMPNDRATVAAHKNCRDLLSRRFGVECYRKFQHVPYVMRRSVWNAIEKDFGPELAASRQHRFRARQDLNGQFLYGHYAILTGAGVSSAIPSAYFDVQDYNLAQKMIKAEQQGAKVFCLNDANSTDENVRNQDLFVRRHLEARFPVAAPWEDPDYADGLSVERISVDLDSEKTLEDDVRRVGAEEAERQYQVALSAGNITAGHKLFRLLYQQGRNVDAANIASGSNWDSNEKTLKRIDALSKEQTTSELAPLVQAMPLATQIRGLRLLVRTVDTPMDYGLFAEVAGDAAGDAELLQVVAAAARRSGQADIGIKLLEEALLSTRIAVVPRADKRRDGQKMKDPEKVLRDLYDVAGSHGSSLFLDAGTMLGSIRENDFIGHDYDIDLSTRDEVAFAEILARMKADWRFNVARVRTPELIIQAKHIDGTNIDVFLHRREGDHWVKKSHVFGWNFADYELVDREFKGVAVKVPSPPETYLEQMYGSDWRIPIAGFDSRLVAPNCFFPDHEEIICTLLNKAYLAAKVGDRADIEKNRAFLRDRLNYQMRGL